jgi:hypothetical protein
MHLKMTEALGTVHRHGRGLLRVMVARRKKVSFRPDGSTSPGNYEWLSVLYSTASLTLEVQQSLVLWVESLHSFPRI